MGQGLFEKFCGRTFSSDEVGQIKEIVDTCKGISRTELASTVCELFDWKRPTGRLKTIECRQFLERLATRGIIELPDRKTGRPKGVKVTVKRTDKGNAPGIITGNIKVFSPLKLLRITTKAQRELWYEYVDRYHYLGYQLPFGAQLRYFIESGNGENQILGCLQFSSPAWKMAPRDRWIGWSDEQRQRNLQKIINNSRFLILPWVRVKNLASSALALAIRSIANDWESCYGYRPLVMETLVDKSRFAGTCYRAANFIYVGVTTGRGRMDREHASHGKRLKDIYVYPLSPRFRQKLSGL
jgi:Druantia protein DruA